MPGKSLLSALSLIFILPGLSFYPSLSHQDESEIHLTSEKSRLLYQGCESLFSSYFLSVGLIIIPALCSLHALTNGPLYDMHKDGEVDALSTLHYIKMVHIEGDCC